MRNENLYAVLRAGFRADLNATAVETGGTTTPLHCTWGDLERASARIANPVDIADEQGTPHRAHFRGDRARLAQVTGAS